MCKNLKLAKTGLDGVYIVEPVVLHDYRVFSRKRYDGPADKEC